MGLSLALRLVAATPARAEDADSGPQPGAVQVKLTGVLRRDFGVTRYRFASTAYVDEAQTVVGRIASELDFPIDVLLGGAALEVRGVLPSRYTWSLGAEGMSNLNEDPGLKMRDYDWLTWPGQFDGKFSSTESDASITSREFGLNGSIEFLKSAPWSLDLVGAVRAYRLDEDLTGISGWQLDTSYQQVNFNIPDTLALRYSIHYVISSVGVRARYTPYPGSSVSFSASPGIASVSDVDDHVLRFKRSTADGTGFALVTAFDARLPLHRPSTPDRLSLVIGGSYEVASVSAKQTQTWYGDDPSTPGVNDTGTVIRNLPHDILLRRGSVSVGFQLGI